MLSDYCLVCGSDALRAHAGVDCVGGVGSDCRPWPRRAALAVCAVCGAVQKRIDDAWAADTAAIYADYALYHQSTERAEIRVFDAASGRAEPRSRRFLRRALDGLAMPSRGRLLDVGCGTGVTLRAFAELYPQWILSGIEPNLKNVSELSDIPHLESIQQGLLEDVSGRFDLISAVHTLEHVTTPATFLTQARERLSETGMLLVQVPYFVDNPFDLLVFDHSLHLTAATLRRLLAEAGFDLLVASADIVPRELTFVARPGRSSCPPVDAGAQRQAVDAACDWLQSTLAAVRSLADKGPVALFGTGIAANWLVGELGDAVAFFVDEDETRAGTIYRDRPVRHPRDVAAGADVFVALPWPAASAIADRLGGGPGRYHRPPPGGTALDESGLLG